MSAEQGLPLDVVVHHELGHAMVGLSLGLVVTAIELVPVGEDWGGLTHFSEDLPPEHVRGFLVTVAAGDQAASVYLAQSGQPRQLTDHRDREQYAEVLAWAANQDTGSLPTFDEAAAEALSVVHQVWGRITALAPKLAEDKNLLRREMA